jgi:uncharacterized protein YpbB
MLPKMDSIQKALTKDYCTANSLEMDIGEYPEAVSAELKVNKPKVRSSPSKARQLAFDLFEQKISIEEAAKSVKRAQSTTTQYLVEFIKRENISNPCPWVDEQTFGRVMDAARQVGDCRIKPIFDFLNGQIDYSQIRISIACLRNNG